jgi:uncharacterized membrane protein YfcA
MWEQYKRTFLGMQLVIAAIAILVFFASHFWAHAIVFYVIMQLGSLLGATWGARLSRKLKIRQCQLPVSYR